MDMVDKLGIATPLAVLLAACATTAPPPAEVRTIHLVCAKTIPLDISHDGETAVVRNATGTQVTLKRDHDAPAPRYSGSGYALTRQDGIYIFIAPGGSARDCDVVNASG